MLSRSDSNGEEHFTLVGFSEGFHLVHDKLKKCTTIDKEYLNIGRWEPDVDEFGCVRLFECLKTLNAWIPRESQK